MKKAIRKRELQVAFSALLVKRNLKRNLRRQGSTLEERMRRQLRNSIMTTQNTMHEHVRLTSMKTFYDFMIESSEVFERLTIIKNFMAGTVLVQRRFRRRQ